MSHTPNFRPHPMFRGGHAQTLAGFLLPGVKLPYTASRHDCPLDDGDMLVLHDDLPESWSPGHQTALLLHGLAGCHQSAYLQRLTAKLKAKGTRVFRLDLRGSGAGVGLSERPYNAGQSADVLHAIRMISKLTEDSPCVLVGFSMGGNLSLKLAGEQGDALPGNVHLVIAVNPPIDLAHSVEYLQGPLNRFYNRYFTRLLNQQIQQFQTLLAEHDLVDAPPARGLFEFDDRFTAPLGGYSGASDYYARASAKRMLPDIRRPTRILMAADDPLIPITCFDGIELSPSTRLSIVESGGHLGYLARSRPGGDRRWMDWQVCQWIEEARS